MENHKSKFDGAVSEFFQKYAPSDLRVAIEKAKKNQIISDHYPTKNVSSATFMKARCTSFRLNWLNSRIGYGHPKNEW